MWLRFLLALTVRSRRSPRLGHHDVSRIEMRAMLTDIDFLGHVNNGRYASLMDIGRIDLTHRTGMTERLDAAGIYGVIGAQTVAYRKSLRLGAAFTLETRFIGADDRSIFLEQRFVKDGEIYARGIARARFLRKSGGTVKTPELSAVCDFDFEATRVPDAVAEWAATVALPPTRAAAPSVWVA